MKRPGAGFGFLVALTWLASCGPNGVRSVMPGGRLDAAEEGGSGGSETGGTGGGASDTGGRPGTGGRLGTGGSTGGSPGTGGGTGGSGTGGSGTGGSGTGGAMSPPDAAPDLAPDLPPDAPETCVMGMAGVYMNNPFPNQTGKFSVRFSGSVSMAPSNGILALSMGAPNSFAGYAASIRFSPMGMIDVVNGADYGAATPLAYAANAVYRFRMTVDVAAHTYSVFVTPPGGSEMTLAMNYAFRSQQATVAGLNSWGVVMQSMATGNLKACGFSLE